MSDMTVTADTDRPDVRRSLHTRQGNARWRGRKDAIMRSLLLGTVALALVPLLLIIAVTVKTGMPAFGLGFITEQYPFSVYESGGGYLQGFVGTGMMVGIAALLSIPLGVFAAVFLVEYRGHPLARPTRFFTDVMTGVPSIFVGLFVFAALVNDIGVGYSTLAGGVALGILMLPIVVRSSEEMLKLVPPDLRNGAFALGARRWQTVTRVVLPAAAPGLVTGSMLAVARAVGETAPLLFTAFGTLNVVTALTNRPQSALTLLAFNDARYPYDSAIARGWAGALALIAITLLLTVIARFIGTRGSLKK